MSKISTKAFLEEAVPGFDFRRAREEAARCLLCHDGPCSEACPAGTNPAKFIRSIRLGNIKGAAETIRENNALGGSCANLCPYNRMCEGACARTGIDRPIEIGKLQRFVVEQEMDLGMKILKPPSEQKQGRVACVGAGPASLACAAQLALGGCRVTVYEAEQSAGGVLSYGIIPARLPQRLVDFDVQLIKDLGVEFIFGTRVGGDISVGELLEKYDAVFVGVGLGSAKLPQIPGIELEGVCGAVDFLKQARSTGGKIKPGEDVIVIGGGDVATDAAAAAKQLGSKRVSIVYRRSIEEAPANMAELAYIQSLGVSMTTEMAPAEVLGEGGKVVGVRFESRDGYSQLKLRADRVVFAVGQALDKVDGITTNEGGLIRADANGMSGNERIFAAGDAVNGGKTVVEAVAEGKTAAEAILSQLGKKAGAN